MKKQITILLIVVGMLIGAGGCGSAPIFPLMWVAAGTVGALSISSENDLPTEYESGAWLVDPNDISKKLVIEEISFCF